MDSGVMSFDLHYAEYGHLLQMLYTFRAFSLTANQIRNSQLDEFLESLATLPISAVATEAQTLMKILKINNPPKREMPELENEGCRRGKRIKVTEDLDVELLDDSHSFSAPQCSSQQKVPISVTLYYWGIRYNEHETMLFGMGTHSLFLLRSSSYRPVPTRIYNNMFTQESHLFECCNLAYNELREMASKGTELKYEDVMNGIWNRNRNDDILVTEEDLIMDYPLLQRELVALDKMKGFSANVNTFGMNDFLTNLEYEHKRWTANQTLPQCVYTLHYDLTTAEFRSSQLRTDQHVLEAIQKGELPFTNSQPYPRVNVCPKEELSCADWKYMFGGSFIIERWLMFGRLFVVIMSFWESQMFLRCSCQVFLSQMGLLTLANLSLLFLMLSKS